MLTFVHAGLPKTLTTALQKSFFAAHPDVYYLGIGADGEIGYADSRVERLFEHIVLYARDELFEMELTSAKELIHEHRERARRQGKRAFGLSLEWLSFRFTADMVESSRIAGRLKTLLGGDTVVLLILRRQDHLLKSLYNEFVKVGLPFGWNEFLQYVYQFRERNFFLDLCYDRTVERFARHFGSPRISLFFLEHFRDKTGKLKQSGPSPDLLLRLAAVLGVDAAEIPPITSHNPSLPEPELAEKLMLNREMRHDFGNLMFEHANLHRQRSAYAGDDLLSSVDVYRDVRRKRMLLAEAHERARAFACNTKFVDTTSRSEIYYALTERFSRSNRILSETLGVELPNGYESFRT